MPIVLKSASLKLLEPSGPVQACTGIALLFTFLHKNYHTQIHLRTLKFAHAPIITDGTRVYLARPRGTWSYITLVTNFMITDYPVKS